MRNPASCLGSFCSTIELHPPGEPAHWRLRSDRSMGSVDGVQGQVTLNPDGTIVFTIDSAFTGAAGFSYVVSDGTESDTATVAVRIDSPFVGWSQGGIGNV